MTLKFDLLLKNFNLGCYLVIVSARQASLSFDNSSLLPQTDFFHVILLKSTSLSPLSVHHALLLLNLHGLHWLKTWNIHAMRDRSFIFCGISEATHHIGITLLILHLPVCLSCFAFAGATWVPGTLDKNLDIYTIRDRAFIFCCASKAKRHIGSLYPSSVCLTHFAFAIATWVP